MASRFARFLLAILLLAPLSVAAQPMVEMIPDDVIVYIGWRGADAVDAEYQQSRLKPVLEASSIPQFVQEFLPKTLKAMSDEIEVPADLIDTASEIAGALWKYPCAAVFSGVEAKGDFPMPRAAILCRAGNDSAQLRKKLEPIIAKSKELPLSLSQINDVLVLQIGLPVGIQPNPAAAAPRPTLQQSPQFQKMLAATQKDALFTVYVDATRALGLADVLAKQEGGDFARVWPLLRDATGLSGVKGILLAGSFSGKDWATHAFILAPAPRQGLLWALLSDQPVTDDVLKLVPQSATWVCAARLNAGEIYDRLRDMVHKVDAEAGQEFDQAVAEASKQAQVKIREELIGTMGDEWAAYFAPDRGAGSLLGFTLVNRLKDAAAAEKAWTTVEKSLNKLMAAEGGDMKIAFQQMRYEGVTIHYLNIPVIAPAWAIADGNLYIALYPQGVSAAARHASGRGKSILDNERFVAVRQQFNRPGAGMIEFCDLSQSARDSYPLLLALMRTYLGVCDMSGLTAPEMVLPPLDRILPHLVASGGVAWTDESGWHAHSVEPFPMSDALASPVHVLATQGQQLAFLPAIMAAGERAAERAQAVACMNNLKQIGLGVIAYAEAHAGQLPPDLAAALQHIGSAQVFLCPVAADGVELPEKLTADWINENASYKYLGNNRVKLANLKEPAQTVLAHEDPEAGHIGTINLLYADGHVEAVTPERGKELIEQSKKAIDAASAAAPPRGGRL